LKESKKENDTQQQQHKTADNIKNASDAIDVNTHNDLFSIY
jgi:hypothetical protein